MSGQWLRWPELLPFGLDVLVTLEPENLGLASLEVVLAGDDENVLSSGGDDIQETPTAAELRRAVARCGSGAPSQEVIEARLARLLAFWRRSRRRASPLILRIGAAGLTPSSASSLPAPRLFLDRLGSNGAEVSWIAVGDLAAEASAYEIELFGMQEPGTSSKRKLGELEHLGHFIVPGGPGARNYTLRRLRPLRRHHVRVRALGPQRSWSSPWSDEVSLKTMSLEAAKEAGHRMTADSFFVPSERRICRSVCGGGAEDTFETAVEDILGSALGAEEQDVAVKNLLAARLCQGGSQDFVRHGARYSKPPSERQQRMQRMRLVLTAKELYKSEYADGNPWSMGPFYYEELGRLTAEAATRIEERIAAAAAGGG